MWEKPIEAILQFWQLGGVIVAVWLIGYAMAKKFEMIFGKDKKGRNILERLERIEYQMYPNGGTSMLDKVEQTKSDVQIIKGELKIIKDLAVKNWD
jgi:hypothetical protein